MRTTKKTKTRKVKLIIKRTKLKAMLRTKTLNRSSLILKLAKRLMPMVKPRSPETTQTSSEVNTDTAVRDVEVEVTTEEEEEAEAEVEEEEKKTMTDSQLSERITTLQPDPEVTEAEVIEEVNEVVKEEAIEVVTEMESSEADHEVREEAEAEVVKVNKPNKPKLQLKRRRNELGESSSLTL